MYVILLQVLLLFPMFTLILLLTCQDAAKILTIVPDLEANKEQVTSEDEEGEVKLRQVRKNKHGESDDNGEGDDNEEGDDNGEGDDDEEGDDNGESDDDEDNINENEYENEFIVSDKELDEGSASLNAFLNKYRTNNNKQQVEEYESE